MEHRSVLWVDAAINLVLGALLILFPQAVIYTLGVPWTEQTFYPRVLGGVLAGVGIAIILECRRPREGMVGLGLGGAVAINLCGGAVLAGLLLSGSLDLAPRGHLFLWALVAILVGISGVELAVHRRTRRG